MFNIGDRVVMCGIGYEIYFNDVFVVFGCFKYSYDIKSIKTGKIFERMHERFLFSYEGKYIPKTEYEILLENNDQSNKREFFENNHTLTINKIL